VFIYHVDGDGGIKPDVSTKPTEATVAGFACLTLQRREVNRCWCGEVRCDLCFVSHSRFLKVAAVVLTGGYRSGSRQLPGQVVEPCRNAMPFAVAASGIASDGRVEPGGAKGDCGLRVHAHGAYCQPDAVQVGLVIAFGFEIADLSLEGGELVDGVNQRDGGLCSIKTS